MEDSLFDNFNDDGINVGGFRTTGHVVLRNNVLSRCTQCVTMHNNVVSNVSAPVDEDASIFLLRNIFDARDWSYSKPPPTTLPTGTPSSQILALSPFILPGIATHAPDPGVARWGAAIGDHGSPVWPDLYAFHNTLLGGVMPHSEGRVWGWGLSSGLASTSQRPPRRLLFGNLFHAVHMVDNSGAFVSSITVAPPSAYTQGKQIDMIAQYNTMFAVAWERKWVPLRG